MNPTGLTIPADPNEVNNHYFWLHGNGGFASAVVNDTRCSIAFIMDTDVIYRILLWISCGGLAAIIAGYRHADVWKWLGLGVLFGPLGVVCAFWSRPLSR